jgi:hypothetical protein
LSNKLRIFQQPLNVSPEYAVVVVKACVVLHNFVRQRDGYKFEDSLAVTDVPDGQSVGGGITLNSARNRVTDYFLADAGAPSWKMKNK